MGSKFEAEQSTITPLHMMMIAVFNKIHIFLGYSILLGGFKLGDEVLDISVVGAQYYGYRADGDFILGDSHEC